MNLNKRLERLESQARYITSVPVVFVRPGRDIVQIPGIGPTTVVIVDDLDDIPPPISISEKFNKEG